MKKYQFTLTENYVSDWTYIEAIRELLQNAYDYGNENVSFNSDSITISNKDDILDIKTLLLGYGTKSNDRNQVGGFGEGFLLALLVLIRSDLKVTVLNGSDAWKPKFEYNEEFGENLLSVEVYADFRNPSKDLDILIEGFKEEQLNNIKRTFLGLDSTYNFIPTTYGEILTDPGQKGRMYVDKLPITSDDNFNYGYNFKARYVRLDRDRRDINTYELKRITSLALTTMESYNFDLIDDLISRGGDDADYIIDDDIDLNDDFVYGYSDYLSSKYKIGDHDIVTTNTDSKVIDELQHNGENVILVEKRVQADIVNRTNSYSSSKLIETKNIIKNRSNIDEAWNNYNYSAYKELREWYLNLFKEDPSNDVLVQRLLDSKEEFFNILNKIEPHKFDYIRDRFNDL